ncbi:hypothetical protein OH76DRAFT_1412189 [Lentinus brumalis]|uniref:Uncharacterized protein n=1 Tax=Lentinus brumalis TaxID=2498619 RepID=A0A371CM10_9APHY|nr:hypothetical protein OH76DRAFT_1412189 [Polyporus brumalis]
MRPPSTIWSCTRTCKRSGRLYDIPHPHAPLSSTLVPLWHFRSHPETPATTAGKGNLRSVRGRAGCICSFYDPQST